MNEIKTSKKEKNNMRKEYQVAFKNQFGFAPRTSEIILLEASTCRLLADVGGKEWQLERKDKNVCMIRN
jgi:hypothetical protein